MSTNPFFRSLTVIARGPIDSKPFLDGLYLCFLEHERHLQVSATLYAATRAIGDVRVIEIKGTGDEAQVIEFPWLTHSPQFPFAIGYRKKEAGAEWNKVLSPSATLHIENLEAFREYEFRASYLGKSTTPNYSDIVSTYAL